MAIRCATVIHCAGLATAAVTTVETPIVVTPTAEIPIFVVDRISVADQNEAAETDAAIPISVRTWAPI